MKPFEKVEKIVKYTLLKQVMISIIVPIHNVEEYLIECLDSLTNQNISNFQVLMIDDGSTDKSGELAKAYAQKDSRFEYYRIENGGAGYARNYAMQFAKGKYIAFADADDIVAPNIYNVMINALERTNSQFAICNVMRFDSKRVWESTLHQKAFRGLGEVVHISQNPSLAYDTTFWNKVVLKSFWDKHQFHIPEHIFYQDIPVTLQMHYFAERVAVVDSVGYFWRVRDGVTKSTTQKISNLQNLYDRLNIMKMVDDFYKEHIREEKLIREKYIKYMSVDLMVFLNNCKNLEPEQAREMMKIVRNYIKENVPETLIDELNVLHKQKIVCAMEDDLEGLIRVLDGQQKDYYNAPIREENGRFFIECSDDIFTIPDRDVTEEMHEISPLSFIRNVFVKGSAIEVLGYLCMKRLDIPTFEEQKVEAFLLDEENGETTPLQVVPVVNDMLTKWRGCVRNELNGKEYHYNYDGTGFKVIVDLKKLNDKAIKSKEKKYVILLKYRNRVAEGRMVFSNVNETLRTEICKKTASDGKITAKLGTNMAKEFTLTLSRKK